MILKYFFYHSFLFALFFVFGFMFNMLSSDVITDKTFACLPMQARA